MGSLLESLYHTGLICILSSVFIQCAISVVVLNCVENYNNHKHLKISGKFIKGLGQYCMSSTSSLPSCVDLLYQLSALDSTAVSLSTNSETAAATPLRVMRNFQRSLNQ